MSFAPPPDALLGLNFDQWETQLSNLIDPVEKVISAIDANPLARMVIPKQYLDTLDSIAHLLTSLDTALHKEQ